MGVASLRSPSTLRAAACCAWPALSVRGLPCPPFLQLARLEVQQRVKASRAKQADGQGLPHQQVIAACQALLACVPAQQAACAPLLSAQNLYPEHACKGSRRCAACACES